MTGAAPDLGARLAALASPCRAYDAFLVQWLAAIETATDKSAAIETLAGREEAFLIAFEAASRELEATRRQAEKAAGRPLSLTAAAAAAGFAAELEATSITAQTVAHRRVQTIEKLKSLKEKAGEVLERHEAARRLARKFLPDPLVARRVDGKA